jgi:hypothetical protein
MKNAAHLPAILGASFIALLHVAPAQAQATRTWVSGSGADANPCSRSAPCQTFAGALSKTAAGGEINCIDAGGFGAVTINKSITIDCGGTFGSILAAGTTGVTVNTAGVKVILRNLSIDGAGTGINGVSFTAGTEVTVEKCSIFGFTNNAINMSLGTTGNLQVIDTTLNASARGIRVTTASGFAIAQIKNVSVNRMSISGVDAAANGFVSVNNSSFAGNPTAVNAGGVVSVVNVTNSLLTNNTTAFNAGAGTTIRISNNKIFDNTTAFAGTIQTGGDNKTAGNGAGGTLAGGVATQ